jgi:hypothetical protein
MVNYTYQSYTILITETRSDVAKERRVQRLASRSFNNKNYKNHNNKNYKNHNKNYRKNGYLKQPGGASCNQRR